METSTIHRVGGYNVWESFRNDPPVLNESSFKVPWAPQTGWNRKSSPLTLVLLLRSSGLKAQRTGFQWGKPKESHQARLPVSEGRGVISLLEKKCFKICWVHWNWGQRHRLTGPTGGTSAPKGCFYCTNDLKHIDSTVTTDNVRFVWDLRWLCGLALYNIQT